MAGVVPSRLCALAGALGSGNGPATRAGPRPQKGRADACTARRYTPGARHLELYRSHARALERRVSRRVQTSHQTIEDACSFAWLALLTHTVTDEHVLGWLFVVATREALLLAQRSQRTVPLPQTAGGEPIELLDPLDPIAARERLIDACALLEHAQLSDRQRRIVGMQAAGHSYKTIAEATGDSTLTVERQLLPARRRIRETAGGGETPSPAGSGRSG